MSNGIFLIQNNGQLVKMIREEYDSEFFLQKTLSQYPDLLADQAGQRLLLISREMGVPSEEGGSNTWSLDHLFVDQSAIPTLVEVKRSSDTRIRREVVGQMLDYAANAVVYWPLETIRSQFEETCQSQGADTTQVLNEFLEGITEEEFWQQLKTNLRAGKIRILFVADKIPNKLRRIVEFLNGQMDPAEVLAIEIPQFTGQGLRTLVPRVIGQTAEAEAKKKSLPREKQQWNESSFFKTLASKNNSEIVKVARRILEWATSKNLFIWWGQGKKTGSFVPVFIGNVNRHQLFAVWTRGDVEIYFQWYQYKAPFDNEEYRKVLKSKLNAIDGVNIPNTSLSSRPAFGLDLLANQAAFEKFIAIFEWFIAQVESVETGVENAL